MKDVIREELKKSREPELKKLALAECLQHLILQAIYRVGGFKHLTFTGGTALRILYHTARYSEDLDFSLTQSKGFRFDSLTEKIQKDLVIQDFPCEAYQKKEKTVAKVDLRFNTLLKEFGLSPLETQKLTVRLDVDMRPPEGGVQEMALVRSPISYTVTTFDLPSLFATKLHAIFFRGFTKGRDYYDLVWFLGKEIKPNLKFLNAAIRQTEGAGHEIKDPEFKKKLIGHLEKVDFAKVRAEVERFLIDRRELEFLAFEPIKSLLRNYA